MFCDSLCHNLYSIVIPSNMATSEEEIKEAFDTFDNDNKGVIHPSDLGTVIRALGELHEQIYNCMNIYIYIYICIYVCLYI